jgi:murein DD-endopeptidase MepM/ murein hydrolase activator NlpD
MNKHKHNQNGSAHLSALVIVVAVVGLVGFAFYRVAKSNTNANSGSSEVSAKAFNFEDCLKENTKEGQDPSKANDLCIAKQAEYSKTNSAQKAFNFADCLKENTKPDSDPNTVKETCEKYQAEYDKGVARAKEANKTSETDATKPVLKGVGFNIDYYNEKTKSAGDMKFGAGQFPSDQVLGIFGVQDPRSPNDPSKRNPQPHIILPEGTKVLSLMDGEVITVEKMYSGDYFIQVASSSKSLYRIDTEHVNNPIVKVGDKVKAGQQLAEVSTYSSQYYPGYGLVEIGVFHTDGPTVTEHLCPYIFLDVSVKDDITSKLSSIMKGWETYSGKNVYDEANYPVPGCANTEAVNG